MNDFVQFFSDSDASNVSTSVKMMLLLNCFVTSTGDSHFNDIFRSDYYCSVIC